MGYNGIGYQRWIATMKPRKFLGKRTKPDGGGGDPGKSIDIRNYFHLNKNNLDYISNRAYSSNYKKNLNNSLDHENQNQNRLRFVSLFISIALVGLLFWYFASNFDWF